MRIAIAGGTGVVGARAVQAARDAGHETVVLSRSSGVDVLDGTGLDAHLEGLDAVIDALNTSSLSLRKATEFFRATTRNLLDAEERQDVDHHVTLSIVGIDGIAVSYYGAKLAQEDEARRSAVPHTIARATQFHEFAGQLAERTSLGPVSLIPRVLCRPVAAREVGEYLVELAAGEPAGRAPDLVGPEEDTAAAMLRKQSDHDGTARRVLEVTLPGAYGRGLASGALRGVPEISRIGQETFAQWLESDRSGDRTRLARSPFSPTPSSPTSPPPRR